MFVQCKIVYCLRILPNDEFQHILGYLRPEDKKNLKLSSKECERRVIALDPSMRTWSIRVVDGDSFEDIIFPLSKAKEKHIEGGNFDDIKLSVYFLPKDEIVDADFMMICIDSILNNWKNNIVLLSMPVMGIEYFLLNPKFKMSQLKNLILSKYQYRGVSELGDDSSTIRNYIARALIRNNLDSLETLDIRNLSNVNTNKSLNVTSLTAYGMRGDDLRSFLIHSCKTLESLKWDCRFYFTISTLDCPELRLKELSLDISANLTSKSSMISILDITKTSLLSLSINGLKTEMKNVFNSIQFGLLKLHYESSHISNFPIILRATTTSLTELTLSEITAETFDILKEQMILLENMELNLIKFIGKRIPGRLITCLIWSSKKTLKEVHLSSISDGPNFLFEGVLQIEKLYLRDISSDYGNLLVRACPDLKDLELHSINCFEFPVFGILKLETLQCTNTCYKFTHKTPMLALQKLEVHRLKQLDSCVHGSSYFCEMNILTEFVCSEASSEYVSKILNVSHNTLKEVKLANIEDGDFNLEKKLKLRRFQAYDVGIDLVKSVLMNQDSPLNMLVLQDVRVKQSNYFDPSLLNMLIEFRAKNPHCLVEIKKTKDDKETTNK